MGVGIGVLAVVALPTAAAAYMALAFFLGGGCERAVGNDGRYLGCSVPVLR